MLLLNIDHVPGTGNGSTGNQRNGGPVQKLRQGLHGRHEDIGGGEITAIPKMLVEARQIATQADGGRSNAIVLMPSSISRFCSSAVMQGAAEVIAYGTAVKLK